MLARHDLGDTERVGAGGDAGLITAPRDEHHRPSLPERLHHRSMSRMADQEDGSLQHR